MCVLQHGEYAAIPIDPPSNRALTHVRVKLYRDIDIERLIVCEVSGCVVKVSSVCPNRKRVVCVMKVSEFSGRRNLGQ